MSYFHRPEPRLAEPEPEPERREPERSEDSPRSPFADVAGRFANWFTGVERLPGEESDADEAPAEDPLGGLRAGPTSGEESSGRFPIAPFGYNRAAVDEHVSALERELEALRAQHEPPISITEELERIGEQTASILVVAHDKAHETTRLAQEQAERCIADAAASAVAMTEGAKQRMRELDNETDAVWHERQRLLEDVRVVSTALATLADEAEARFPAAVEEAATTAFPAASARSRTPAFPIAAGHAEVLDAPAARRVQQPTEAFAPAAEAEGDSAPAEREGDEDPRAQAPEQPSGDTASWLAGFEPPDYHYPT